MTEFETNDGNEQAQSPTDQGTEQRVNPGAIRKSTTQSILKAASQAAGMEFESVEAMAAAFARLSAQSSVAPQQPVTEQNLQNRRATTTDLQEQFVSLKQDLAKKEQALRERELDGEIRQAMGDKFDTDLVDYALSKVRANIQWDNGNYLIVNSKGQVRYGEDGSPLQISGLVDEVAKTNPKLLRMSQTSQSGSGLRPQQGMFGGESEMMPDYSKDPAAFNAWANRSGLGRGVGLKSVSAQVSNSMNRKTF